MSDEYAYFGPMQYWSENHQLGWYAAQYLIGHAFAETPDLAHVEFKPSGLTGAEMRDDGRERLLQWLEYRVRFGYSEFNSDTYGPVAYKALLPVSVLAPDEEIRMLAKGVQTLQEFDHIIGSRGTKVATARGRAYSEGMVSDYFYDHIEDTSKGDYHFDHLYLLKGSGKLEEVLFDNRSTYFSLNILHGDQYPTALLEIGQQVEASELVLKERFGIGSDEGKNEGKNFKVTSEL